VTGGSGTNSAASVRSFRGGGIAVDDNSASAEDVRSCSGGGATSESGTNPAASVRATIAARTDTSE